MSETERDYAIGYGKPPRGRRFEKGQSGNPRGPGIKKSLPALLVAALDEPVTITINGRRRKITKREAIVTQMVDKSAAADLRATKMLIDMLKEAEAKVGATSPERAKLTAPDREVVDQFVARLRRQIAAEAAAGASFETPPAAAPQDEDFHQ
jgi:hypothetical protein